MADEEAPTSGGAPEPSDHHMLADLWHEHKTPIMIVIAAATLLLTAIMVFRKQSSASSSVAAPGTSSGAAVVPSSMTSDSTSAYTSLTGYMQAILQQLQSMGSGGSGSSSASGSSGTGVIGAPILPNRQVNPPTPTPAPPPSLAPVRLGQATPSYVTVARWTPNPVWNSTLSGIASYEGTSLTRIEQLNPQITNPNLIQPGQQVRVS